MEWYWFSSTECIAWLAIFMTAAVAIVTFNIITIIVFMRNRSLRKRSMYLVINLAVADMFVGGFSGVIDFLGTGNTCNFWQYNVPYGGIWDYVILNTRLLFPVTSLSNIAAISLERLHATFFPFKHRVIRKWIFGVVITVVWVTAALITTVSTVPLFYTAENGISYTWPAFILICLSVIFVSYAAIAVKIHCGTQPQHHGAASRKRKLTKKLFIMTLVSLLMWLPWGIFHFFRLTPEVFSNFSMSVFRRILYSLIVLFYTNSLVSPILYTFVMPEFKRALVSLFRRRAQQQGQVQVFPQGPEELHLYARITLRTSYLVKYITS